MCSSFSFPGRDGERVSYPVRRAGVAVYAALLFLITGVRRIHFLLRLDHLTVAWNKQVVSGRMQDADRSLTRLQIRSDCHVVKEDARRGGNRGTPNNSAPSLSHC